MSETTAEPTSSHQEPPPFGSWRRMYTFVLGCLGIEIVLFYLFTRFFE